MKTESVEQVKSLCLDSITKIIDKYQSDSYALQRIVKHCLETMPSTIESNVQQHADREERISTLKEESQTFIHQFMNSNIQYLYFSSSNIFVTYDSIEFKIILEDDIIYKILSMLSTSDKLAVWKHKIKANILKKIKEKDLADVVPSSTTVQKIISQLYPAVFGSRDEAKYFLTIIGDSLSKKETNNLYFAHHRLEKLIEYISHEIVFFKGLTFGPITQVFRYKYQGHNFDNCRILKIQGHGDNLNFTKINPLELYFVAQYYSTRYHSADQFLNQISEKSKCQHAQIISRLSSTTQVAEWFATKAFDMNNMETDSLDKRAIQFIWKRFCQKMKIPEVISMTNIVRLLENYQPFASRYSDSKKMFIGITGKTEYLPSVALFNEFWQTTVDKIEINDIDSLEYELTQLEIDEISTMFGSWLRKNGKMKTTHAPLEDDEIIACLKHFFPEVIIEEDKYIYGYNCLLWDKQQDIKGFIDDYMSNNSQSPNVCLGMPNSTMYRAYCLRNLRTSICLASKNYFDKVYSSYYSL